MASDAVQQLMGDNRLPPPVQTYLVTTLGLDTLARVHNAFEDANVNVSVNAILVANAYHVHPAGTPAQQLQARRVGGDIKQFWREAVAENEQAIRRKATRVDESPTGPLPVHAATQLTTAWNARYDFELLPTWKLSPNQQGRLAREIDKALLTMWIMSKVKTLPMARHDNIAQRV